MKTFEVAFLILLLIYATASIRWPLHTVCKNDRLELYYRSCDPVQDFAFSFDSCASVESGHANIRLATILRHSIRELSVDVSLDINGNSVMVYSSKICEPNNPRFTFCGKRRGGLGRLVEASEGLPAPQPSGWLQVSQNFPLCRAAAKQS